MLSPTRISSNRVTVTPRASNGRFRSGFKPGVSALRASAATSIINRGSWGSRNSCSLPRRHDATFIDEQTARQRRRASLLEDLKVGLTLIALLAAVAAFVEAERVNSLVKRQIDNLKDRLLKRSDFRDIGLKWAQDIARDPVTREKVDNMIEEVAAQHSPTIRKAVFKYILNDNEFVTAVVDWSKEQAIAVCRDPETVQAMTDLLAQAIEQPSTLKATQDALDEFVKRPETQEMVKEFLVKTVNDRYLQNELTKAGKGTLETLANDRGVQEAISGSLWNITKKAITPWWFTAVPDSDPAVSAVKKLKRIQREHREAQQKDKESRI